MSATSDCAESHTTQHSIIANMAGLPPRPNFTPAPTAPAPLSNKVEVKHCVDWLKGACTRGDDCRYHHDPRLDPNLRDLKGPQLPSGPTCRRCADLQRPCDKEGRGGLDDPCSECRWYGGEGCACVLYALSLNDALWGLMVTRRKQGFNLPEFRARNYFNFGHGMGKDGQKPKPMPTSELKKDGWVGETQAQLEAKGDMLLPDMRKNPRKYLDPPVVSKKELGKEARLDKIQKRVGSPTFNERKRNKTLFDKQPSWQGATLAAGLPATNMFGLPASNAFRSFPATQNASAGNFPPAALNGRPSMESTRGVSWAETITWSYSSSRWVATTWCEPDSLAQQRVPPQQVEDLQFRPVRHSLSGAATLATWSYVTRRWTIKWADDTSMESAQYGQSVPPVALGQVSCFSILCTSYRQYIDIHLVRSCPTSSPRSSGSSTSSTTAAYCSSGRSSGNTCSCPCGHSSERLAT
jgi:hypothetical protein